MRLITEIPFSPARKVFNLYRYLPAPLTISSNFTEVVTINPPEHYLFESADDNHLM